MFYIVLNLIAFSLQNSHIEKILPPLNNIYKTKINIPFIGNQEIEYERIRFFESEVRLHGLLNEKGIVYIDKKNIYNYTFDEVLQNIIKKYKCDLYKPYYSHVEDIIVFKIKIKLLKFTKTLVLKNINR
tara:strand:+ start:85 stop:471 length:387 start_codon:yes stop_codon:yes gene_type:complete